MENFARLFSAIKRDELVALRALPWQNEPLTGETVAAVFSNETGLNYLAGAVPFIATEKHEPIPSANREHIKSEALAQFLIERRSLLRSYLQTATEWGYTTVGDLTPAHITHITTDIAGMDAANFAIFYAAQIASLSGKKTLLIDADPQNQFVFPLLTFAQPPKILTEHLQKPATFKADLNSCIVTLGKNFSYLNLQAPSLRAFGDDEIARLCGFLDADFDNLVFYAGQFRSAWLSANAHTNYAVCAGTYKTELKSVLRHAGGSHTVLLRKSTEQYLPCLSDFFSQKRPLEDWQTVAPAQVALKEFIVRTYQATRLVIGGHENLPGHLHCLTGFDLYAHYAALQGADAERALNALQKRLRAFYPKSAFFSARSVLSRVKNLPHRVATTMLEIGEEPQLVSLASSTELRAAAIFPAGILPAILVDGVRVSACTAHGFTRFRSIAARGGFTSVLAAPRYRLTKPNALAAIMEQVQA